MWNVYFVKVSLFNLFCTQNSLMVAMPAPWDGSPPACPPLLGYRILLCVEQRLWDQVHLRGLDFIFPMICHTTEEGIIHAHCETAIVSLALVKNSAGLSLWLCERNDSSVKPPAWMYRSVLGRGRAGMVTNAYISGLHLTSVLYLGPFHRLHAQLGTLYPTPPTLTLSRGVTFLI